MMHIITLFLFAFVFLSASMEAADARVQPGTLASVATAATPPAATGPVIISAYSPVVEPERKGNRFVRVIKNHPKAAFVLGAVGTFAAVALAGGGGNLPSSRDPGYRTVSGRGPCVGDPRACGIGIGGEGGR